jgi:hypothetical protein
VLYLLISTEVRVSTPDLCLAQDFVLFAGVHRGAGMLMDALPFSDDNGELVPGYPGDDRKALRSFAYSHYVRRLGIV